MVCYNRVNRGSIYDVGMNIVMRVTGEKREDV